MKAVVYVDGSFDPKINKYAYGCIILKEKEEGSDKESLDSFEAFKNEEDPYEILTELSGSGNEPEVAKIHNVAGEMLGAMNAVRWARRNGYDSIELHYDYTGIEMWATGKWKTKNEYTKGYAEYMKKASKELSISFVKVAAHTGNKYNEQADKLAKSALTAEFGN